MHALAESGHITGGRGAYRLASELDGQVLIATRGAAAGARIETVLARAMRVVRASGGLVVEPRTRHELTALAHLRGDDLDGG